MNTLHTMTILFTLTTVLIAVITIALAIPMIKGKIKPNRIYGFKTNKTLSDATIWYKANTYAGKVMVFTGIIMIFFSLLFLLVTLFTNVFDNSPVYVTFIIYGLIFFVPLIGMVVASLAYLRHL